MISLLLYNSKLQNLANYGDILAIPFFMLLVRYFYNIKNRTFIENLLLLFSVTALLADILFTCIFIFYQK